MTKIDPKTLDKMPTHVRERIQAIDATEAVQAASGAPSAALVTDVAPITITTKYVAKPAAAPAPVAVVVEAPLPERVATSEELGNLFGGAAPAPAAAAAAAPAADEEMTKLRAEVARLTAEQAKSTGFKFADESRTKYIALLGEEGTALLEADMARLQPKDRPDALTREDLVKHQAKQAETKFFSDLPKDFYRHASSADTEFMQWAKTTKDGRRFVKDEIGEIVKARDASGLTYIAEKLKAWQDSRKQPTPGTHVGAPAPATTTAPDKTTATAEDQAAARAAIRRGDLKGAGEILSQFS